MDDIAPRASTCSRSASICGRRESPAVERWVTPEEFERYREMALAQRLPRMRRRAAGASSYRAERALERNNAGWGRSRRLQVDQWLPISTRR
jgi:hypothetical protein